MKPQPNLLVEYPLWNYYWVISEWIVSKCQSETSQINHRGDIVYQAYLARLQLIKLPIIKTLSAFISSWRKKNQTSGSLLTSNHDERVSNLWPTQPTTKSGKFARPPRLSYSQTRGIQQTASPCTPRPRENLSFQFYQTSTWSRWSTLNSRPRRFGPT
jgi:hypothetical protein